MQYAILFSRVCKTFPSAKGPLRALQGLDLQVPHGGIFGFLGPNGAGKTTTLRIATTLLSFDEGEAIVAGGDVQKDPQGVRRRIGYVSQKGGADSRATGWENLLLQGRLYGMSKEAASEQAKGLVKHFALEECIHRFVSTYSGGQQRRLDIALGMMHRPEVLFLDEPTNGLDPQSRANLWTMIVRLRQEGVTIFLTSHYLDEVDALADSLAILDHGKVVALGTPATLKKEISGDVITLGIRRDFHPSAISLLERRKDFVREVAPPREEGEQDLRLYVDKGELALPQILRLLDQANIQCETLQMSSPSLNDVFLKKTGRLLREEVTP